MHVQDTQHYLTRSQAYKHMNRQLVARVDPGSVRHDLNVLTWSQMLAARISSSDSVLVANKLASQHGSTLVQL